MSRKKIIIISVITLIFAVIIGINFYIQNKKQDTDQEPSQEQPKEELIIDLQNEIGGEIIKTGFNISYESTKDIVIITITDIPLEENKENAFYYLERKGINICNINYLLMPGRGISFPEDFKEAPAKCE